MSNREKCHAMIDSFTDRQLISITTLLSSVKALADESADDAFCSRLYSDYQANSDKGEPVSVEDFARELGVTL